MTTLPALDANKTLRPGLLVALSTRVAGNVKHFRKVIDEERIDDNGTATKKWETEKTIQDAAEQKAAEKVRTAARYAVARICAKTAFGLLCPEADADVLRGALAEAQKLVNAFNETATVTRVVFVPLTGRVAADDVEAVKAINKEIRTLVSVMEEGVRNLDVKKIRDAADEARELGQMLNPDAQARITVAIEAARATARAITKAGENVAQEIDMRAVRALTEVRTAFLDLDETGDVAKPFEQGRAVDLGTNEKVLAAGPAVGRGLDLS